MHPRCSLRAGNPVVAPNYLKGGTRIQSIVQEAHELNETKKQEFAQIIRNMNGVLVEEVKYDLKLAI